MYNPEAVVIQQSCPNLLMEMISLNGIREYVFDGYQAQAINYLLKPVSPEAIERSLDKYISLHSSDYYCLHKDNNISLISVFP